MLTHLIYGFFGLMAASVIALAIYLDKPAQSETFALPDQEEALVAEDEVDQTASVAIAGSSSELLEVLKVIDGDTISVRKAGSTETIRLIGINAPETGQCYTSEATQRLKNLIGSSGVSLELDESQGERDKYDRLLAYVFTGQGVNTGKALIEGGFAKEYTYSRAHKYQGEYKAAQTSAQAAGRGLWAQGTCSKPAPAAAPTPTSVQTQVAPPPTIQATEAPQQKTTPVKKEPVPAEPEDEEEEQEEEDENLPTSSGSYTCSSNTYNCDSFSTHAEAQSVFDMCGGASNDIHRLDANKDGEACESLP